MKIHEREADIREADMTLEVQAVATGSTDIPLII